MNWDAIAAIADVVAAVAVVATLLYVAAQVRQNTKQLKLAAQQATVHELGQALRAQAQDRQWADLLSRALHGLDNLDPVERIQFLSHIGSIFRLYESAHSHFTEGAMDPRFWRGFENAIADVLGYQGIQEALGMRRHHLSEEFSDYLDMLLSDKEPKEIFGQGRAE